MRETGSHPSLSCSSFLLSLSVSLLSVNISAHNVPKSIALVMSHSLYDVFPNMAHIHSWKTSALLQRAIAMDVSEYHIAEAVDSQNPKPCLVMLLFSKNKEIQTANTEARQAKNTHRYCSQR